MPLPVITNTWRVTVRGVTAHSTPWNNVIHLHKTSGSAGPGDVPALVTELNKLYGGASYGGGGLNLLNNANSSVIVSDYVFELLDGLSASLVQTATAAGSGVVQALPPECSVVVTLRTQFRGRSNRGRIYLPAYTTSSLTTGGVLSSGIPAAIVAQCSGFQTAIGALTYSWVVASYLNAGVNTISSWFVDTNIDVQRRRKS
jgi:hypothetical protein